MPAQTEPKKGKVGSSSNRNDVNLVLLMFTLNMYLSAWNTFFGYSSFFPYYLCDVISRYIQKYWSAFPSHYIGYKNSQKKSKTKIFSFKNNIIFIIFIFWLSLRHPERFLLLLPPGPNCGNNELFSPKYKISEPLILLF